MADFSRLPGPNADLWDWQLRGLCRGKDSSLFFHPEGERGAARSGREVAAKEICLNCPVQIPCVEHALRVREPYGVWGGMTEDEREEFYAKQKVLARAQVARVKAAKAAQARLKEQLLREKAAQSASAAAPVASAASAPAVSAVPAGANASDGLGHGAAVATATRSAGPEQAEAAVRPQSAQVQPQPVRAANARTAEDLAGTVAAVKRARKSGAEPAKKAAPSKTAPKSATAKSAPSKSPANAPKTAPKRLAKV
jgi:WhiB family transcriptional regulator, redox-sensing transcriptional regulator